MMLGCHYPEIIDIINSATIRNALDMVQFETFSFTYTL